MDLSDTGAVIGHMSTLKAISDKIESVARLAREDPSNQVILAICQERLAMLRRELDVELDRVLERISLPAQRAGEQSPGPSQNRPAWARSST